MQEKHFAQVYFVKTATLPQQYPTIQDACGNPVPEIAVVGRSNVGKSSLLNHLFQRKNLVKTSSTPGKTQTIQFFSAADRCLFIDLPGYGYARVSHSVQKTWGPMMQSYFRSQSSLRVILFLLDIRRVPNEEDCALFSWFLHQNIPMLIVLTKTDKVRRTERYRNTQAILQRLGHPALPCLHASVQDPKTREALIASILTQLKLKEGEYAA